MANITDYLRWRGDLPLSESPFNDVDALILATISYVDFRGVVPEGVRAPGMTMGDACRELLDRAGGNLAPYVRSMATIDSEFLRELGRSRRFGRLVLHGLEDVEDETRGVQFAALQIDLPGISFRGGDASPAVGTRYVSFRGTDLSVTGWREDFMLSFQVTGAQVRAAEYLRDVLADVGKSGEHVVLGGHSKGGNLSAYAVAACDPSSLGLVDRSYCFDGPGMDARVQPRSAFDALGDRFVRYQPSYSVIGELFDRPEEPRTYVASSQDAMMQHDPMSWQVARDGFEVAGGLDPRARIFDDAVEAWVAPIDLEERERFTNELFGILGAAGPELSDIGTRDGLAKVAGAASGASEETKALVGKLVESLVTTTIDRTATAAREAYEGAVQTMRERAADVAGNIVSGASGLIGNGLAERHIGDGGEKDRPGTAADDAPSQ